MIQQMRRFFSWLKNWSESAVSKERAEGIASEQSENADETITPSTISGNKIIDDCKKGDATNEDEEEKHYKIQARASKVQARSSIVQAVFAVLIFIVTCAYTVAAFLQWDAANGSAKSAKSSAQIANDTLAQMKRDSDSSSRQFSEQIRISKVNADAAKSAADTAVKSLQETQENRRLADEQFATQLHRLDASIAAANRLAKASEGGLAESQRVAAINESNFLKDQRPWIWMKAREDPQHPETERLTAHIDIANFGKTPAFKTTVQMGMMLLAKIDLDKGFRIVESFKATNVGIIPPGSVPGPIAVGWFSGNVSMGAKSATIADLIKADGAIAVVGIARYYDAAGNVYRSDFCEYRMANGTYAPCDKHNDMK